MISRRLDRVSLALGILFASAAPAFASDVAFRIPVPPVAVVSSPAGDRVTVADPAWSVSSDAGREQLPLRVVQVLLPPGETFASMDVTPGESRLLRADISPLVAGPALTTDGNAAAPAAAIAPADGAERARYLGTSWLHGYAIASIAVYPFETRDGGLYAADDVAVVVHTRAAGVVPVRRERLRAGMDAGTRAQLSSLVVNPDAIAAYPQAGTIVPEPTGGFQPSIFPSLEGSAVDYVIITNDAMAATFQTLADWKTEKGVPTVVRTTEWIAANYLNGSDEAETIRNFVIAAYTKWGIRYVLLGGDTEEVPVRMAYSAFYDGGRMLPVDMYYGCLDGDWNADHDAVFGEYGQDDADLMAEVYTGRLPAQNSAEAAAMINKVKEYEKPSQPSYGNKILLLGEVLFPSNYHPGDPVSLNGADLAEFMRASYMTDPSLSITRMYETSSLFPGSLPETRLTVIDSLNAGYDHVVHVGHGFRFNMSVGDASIQNADADALTNATRLANFNLLNCTACAYTYECLGEHLLRNPNGGAVSVVGSNESAFPTTATTYVGGYYNLILLQDVVHLGEAFARSREPRTSFAEASDGVDRWTHFVYTLLGDPEMPLWTKSVSTLAVSHPASVNKGTNLITVTVLDGGNPVDSAFVCLSKDGDDYEAGNTNGSGQVTFSFRAESAGSIKVVVTGRNHKRYDGTVTVGGTGAYVALDGMTVDDDSLSGTSGNGNGIIESGETVDLALGLKNTGTAASGNVTVKLRSGDFGVTIVDSTASAGVINSGQTLTATGGVRVTFGSGLNDGHPVSFILVILNNGTETWRDTFKKESHRAKLSLVKLRVDDTVTGNGNGVVDAGEQFKLYYKVKNFGSGAYPGGSMSVTDIDAGFTVISGADTYGGIAPLASAENTAGLVLVEPSVAVAHRLRIQLTDLYGRVYADTVELRAPVPPTALVIDPGLGPDRLQVTWTASASTDVSRYNLYRSLNSGGPFTLSNVDPVPHTLFVDLGLAPTTKYYYKASCIDSSGNESALSSVYSGSTNPAQASGWPVTMELETASSPAVGDLDGDGIPEIVVGDKYVYAWHASGDEVIDGDGSPATWGVLSTQGQSYVGHVALARLDTSPGLEIVAPSRDTKQVFVFRHTGAPLSGWPRSVENFIRAGAAVGDLDGDGVLEVVAIDEAGVLYAWHNGGSEFIDGDANPVTQGVFKRLTGCTFQYSTPALADIDNDGRDEIIVGTQGNELHAFNHDLSEVTGFPVVLTDDISGSPAVGDVDGNGTQEIVVFVRNGTIRAIHPDGTNLWTRFVATNNFFAPSPALADVDNDGKLETFVPTFNGKLYAITYTGADRAGFPVTYSATTYTESSPIVADIDGDGLLDVMLGSEEKFIWGWDRNGVPLDGFPLKTDDAMRGVPQLADVDLDGDIDLVAAGWDKNLYVWDFMGAWDSTRAPWPRFHANTHNNGHFGYLVATPVGGATFSYIARGTGVDLVWAVPPQAGGLFTVSRAEVTGGTAGRYEAVARGVALDLDGLVRLTDRRVEMGASYVYRLEGEGGVVSETMPVVIPVTRAKLGQNFPNPFNPVTKIEYWVAGEGAGGRSPVSVVVYDVRGARVRTLVNGERAEGRYIAEWDGRNDQGSPVSSGVYFYRMTSTRFSETRKMLLIK